VKEEKIGVLKEKIGINVETFNAIIFVVLSSNDTNLFQ